ncbi:DRTGG domain protein [Clostridium tepidiprofundi DSM 19306]|uniref:DRTGG domain protein n=1 Tax=Clostridium tepidiprofundi DSM 19306 TaxID=1121338 RepID=A0A151B316_9CLOT|nr:DRTGG domain-containing protein [Clostridium tepidiprofundi]KYH34329.1 DRTGG domain protein [Clostridium tepidiprofundi DSM 19306]
MKVREIVNNLSCKVLAGHNGLDREVKGVYINDLLSWVMSHGNSNNIWITVQTHPNVIAVASLLDFSCVIIPENSDIEEVTLKKADDEGIPILQTELSGYELCSVLNELGV